MAIFGKPTDNKPAPLSPPAPAPPPPPPPPAAPAPAAALPAAAHRQNAVCVIGPQISIKGEITGDEDILVEGIVEGHVQISKDVRVGEKGIVKAMVEAQAIIIYGEVIGDCHATSRVEIQSTGRLTGDIRAPRIIIAEGAMFRGNSDMSSGRPSGGKA
jgi:cytoskeletal protein CcmA (bactofilin family)